jgi:hypothetical protein
MRFSQVEGIEVLKEAWQEFRNSTINPFTLDEATD